MQTIERNLQPFRWLFFIVKAWDEITLDEFRKIFTQVNWQTEVVVANGGG